MAAFTEWAKGLSWRSNQDTYWTTYEPYPTSRQELHILWHETKFPIHVGIRRNEINCHKISEVYTTLKAITASPSGRAVRGVGLRPLTCWDCGFVSRWGQGCLSVVSVVCCQIEVSTMGRSLVQKSPTEYSVSDCDREAWIIRRPWPTGGHCAMGGGGGDNYTGQ